jgi:AAA15 family ATPase/GTPase
MSFTTNFQRELDRFANDLAHANAAPVSANHFFDSMLQQVKVDRVTILKNKAHEIFSQYRDNPVTTPQHVGAFRSAPKIRLTRNNLADRPEWLSWLSLLDGVTINFVNDALKSLEVPFSIEIREIRYAAFRPGEIELDDLSKAEVRHGDQELVFRDEKGNSHPIHSLGSGFGVILPILIALAAENASFLSIEEPECHIHPKLQAALGDIVSKSSIGSMEKRTFIETHSEHLILRILRRIRETTDGQFDEWPEALKNACPNGIRPEDVAVLYVKPGVEGAQVIELPVTLDGDFSCAWPSGFFTERDKELF